MCLGNEIDDADVWRTIIDKVKNYIHVWRSRKIPFTGKRFIDKNMIHSLFSYEIGLQGIPNKYTEEQNNII